MEERWEKWQEADSQDAACTCIATKKKKIEVDKAKQGSDRVIMAKFSSQK